MDARISWTRRLHALLGLFLALSFAGDLVAQRLPGDDWMVYEDVGQAGFDPERLEAARRSWEALPSSAFMVVADGAVVAAWGDVDRRFMCHSVRKSFLSALYGIYWDRGEIELNKTMTDLGIDDYPDPLLATERRARILDLLKARSGVFHPAAYAGRTDSRPRGSEGPGRYFAYNNWDFNTLAAILAQETGAEVFTAFDEHFARPLGMEDWRVSDGFYHYERDKSRFPAYPFRMSARDAARFGLLFAREGVWGDHRVLSRNWVRRSTALYSIDDEALGYGFMWWVYREPRFLRHGMYSALGVGNQMIAVLPELDLVIVNRADTYGDVRTPLSGLLDLIEEVLQARTGAPAADPELVPLAIEPDPRITSVPDGELAELVGEWTYPAAPLGLPSSGTTRVRPGDGHLVAYFPFDGTFRLYRQPDGTLHAEDSLERYWPVRAADGSLAGLAAAEDLTRAAVVAAAREEPDKAQEFLEQVGGRGGLDEAVGQALVDLFSGDRRSAERRLDGLTETHSRGAVAAVADNAGEDLLELGRTAAAIEVYELLSGVFPGAPGAWTDLGAAYEAAGREAEAVRAYERALELEPGNQRAQEAVRRLHGD